MIEMAPAEKSRLAKTLWFLLIIISAYFAVKVLAEVKGLRFIGGGVPSASTISFDGKGEVSAAPDLATVSFTISEDAADVKTAQSKVTAKESAALGFLAKAGIDKKDIKTENYSTYPKYDYGTNCYGNFPCRPGSPKIIGYTVSENISVKIHDLTKAGDVVQGIGNVGISDMNGPNFSIENEDALKAKARKMAIDEAKAKAKSLAGDLGVSLIRIVNFSENGNYPIMYEAKAMIAADGGGAVSPPAPELPTGENKITSNVTITYEIR